MQTDVALKLVQMYSPIMRSQENDIVSSIKAILETHVAVRRYYNYSERIVRIIHSNSITQWKQCQS